MIKYMYDYSFYVTYILTVTTGTITLIEALRTKNQVIRNVLNLETCISIVAAYFYNMFITRLDTHEDITSLRYMDWCVTTPMMLISLILTIQFNYQSDFIPALKALVVLMLNYGMLLCGYLGEIGIMNKIYANALGFMFFIGLFTYIYKTFMKKYVRASLTLFIAYVVIWSMYGIVYFLPYDEKMLGYNILDLIAKCLVGIALWLYFAKIIRF